MPEKPPEGYSRDQFEQDLEAALSSVLKPANVAKGPPPGEAESQGGTS